jgi:hypothetical protein
MQKTLGQDQNLYETDFVLWSKQQAAALREGRFADLDLSNLSEEIEALARSDRRELRSRLTVLQMHLLKLEYQPERATRSWLSTIVEQATKITELLRESPTLHGEVLTRAIVEAYADGRRQASVETALPLDRFAERPTPAFGEKVQAALWGHDFGGEEIVRQAESTRKGRRVRRR